MEEKGEINRGTSRPLEDLGSQISERIPRVRLDTDDINDPIVIKFKRYALIILSSIVGAGALFLVVKSIIGKVFG